MTQTLEVMNRIFFAAACVLSLMALYNFVVRTMRMAPAKKGAAAEGKNIFHRLPVLKNGQPELPGRAYGICLFLILLAGVLIRLWQFGAIPGGFNQDGAMAAVDGKALADYGTDRFGTWMPAHLYAWGYGQMSSLLSYLIAVFVKLFDLSVVTARLPQLLASVMGGIFFYLFMRDNFGRGAGLIAAVFVAINPWHLVQSRWALDCNLLPHFFMGGLYFLSRGIRTKARYTYISMIYFALCMYCYGITIYTIPVFLLAAGIYYLVRKQLSFKELLISAGIYLLLAWPFLLTMAVNFFKWDTIRLPFVTIQYFSGSVRSSDILLFSEQPMQQLALNFQALLNTTVRQQKDLPWNDIAGFGTMYLWTMPFAVLGIVQFFKKKAKGAEGLALLALLTGVWAGLLTNNVNVNRINIIYYGIMMFAVLGIYFVITELKSLRAIVPAMYLVMAVLLCNTYFTTYADEIAGYFYDGFGEALEAAEASGSARIYVTADAQGVGYSQTSEIITMFYDKTDAKYFQGETNTEHGEELLPYGERFIYVSMSAEVAAQALQEDAALVIREADQGFFDTSVFEIQSFGRYCAVTKK